MIGKVITLPPKVSYAWDAERDIGIVPFDATLSTADFNTEQLNLALAAMWHGGSFTFMDGSTGPVLRPIHFQGKSFYFSQTINFSNRLGSPICGSGSARMKRTEGDFDTGGTAGGCVTSFFRVDGGTGNTQFVKMPSGCVSMMDLDLYAKRTSEGTRTSVGIEIGGRVSPPSGRHTISNVGMYDFETGIDCVPTPDNEHADLCMFNNLWSLGCDTFYRSSTLQACWHIFLHPYIEQGANPLTCFDIVSSGGKFEVYSLNVGAEKVKVLRTVDGLAPNLNRFSIGFSWDHSQASMNNYCTLYENAGSSDDLLDLRMTGHINNPQTTYDESKLVLRGNTPASGLLFDITNLPKDNFTILGSGPWYRPN